MGDSLIIAGSHLNTKLHIHTDEPGKVFRVAREYGVLSDQKIDDMHKQYAASHDVRTNIAVVVDSACDLPLDVLEKDFVHMVPVKVLFGEETYIDKIALKPSTFYELLRSRPDVIGTTSQPAPADFQKVFTFLGDHYEHVVYIALSGGLSGTIKSAYSALERLRRKDSVHIVDSKSVTIGSGLIARRVIEAVEQGMNIEALLEFAESLIRRTRLLITIPSLSALLRSGRLSRAKGAVAGLLKLRPLLTLDSQGRVIKATMVRGADKGKDKILSMIRRDVGEGEKSDFAIAHVDSVSLGAWFRERIMEEFETQREVFVQDASPALALHTGFGTAAVAYFKP